MTVFQTPLRSTAIMSSGSGSLVLSSVWPLLPIPVLATMMSSLANCSTPASTAAVSRVPDQIGRFGPILLRSRRDLHAVDLLADVDGDDASTLLSSRTACAVVGPELGHPLSASETLPR